MKECKYCGEEFEPTTPKNVTCVRCQMSQYRRKKKLEARMKGLPKPYKPAV